MVIFRDVYGITTNLEMSLERMGVDIENVACNTAKCLLTEEQQNLADAYSELINTEIDLKTYSLTALFKKIVECNSCITLLNDGEVMLPPAPPVASFSNCPSPAIEVTKEMIDKVRVYEMTSKGGFSDIEVYVTTMNTLPYRFEPSVPLTYRTYEEYTTDWSDAYGAYIISLNHALDPNWPIPLDSFNIAKVTAQLTIEAQGIYGVTEVDACEAILLTDGVDFKTGHELEKSIDGTLSTWTVITNQPHNPKVGFRFKLPG